MSEYIKVIKDTDNEEKIKDKIYKTTTKKSQLVSSDLFRYFTDGFLDGE